VFADECLLYNGTLMKIKGRPLLNGPAFDKISQESINLTVSASVPQKVDKLLNKSETPPGT